MARAALDAPAMMVKLGEFGFTSANFAALWADEAGGLHYVVALSPELAHVGDAIEELLVRSEMGPITNVLKLPVLEAEPEEAD